MNNVNKKCISLSFYAVKILRSCSTISAVRDFVDVCILPYLFYSLPSYVGFLNVDSIVLIRRLLRRLAAITGRNKEEYCQLFFQRFLKITNKFTLKYTPALSGSSTRSRYIAPSFNKKRTQCIISYIWYFRKSFFSDLEFRLCS